MGATPKAAQIGIKNTVFANFYVPNGTIWLRQGTEATGSFIGKDVIVGINSKVALDSYIGTGSLEKHHEVPFPGQSLFDEDIVLPETHRLLPNYPNPFNLETMIKFELPENNHVIITVYNIMGKRVVTLIDAEMKAGFHDVRWNGKDHSGLTVSGGIYLYHMRAGSYQKTIRMLLLK